MWNELFGGGVVGGAIGVYWLQSMMSGGDLEDTYTPNENVNTGDAKDYTDVGDDPETHGYDPDWDRPPADPTRESIPVGPMGSCPEGYRKIVWFGGRDPKTGLHLGGSACLPIITT